MNSIKINQSQSFKGAFIKTENVKLTRDVLVKLSNNGESDIWIVPLNKKPHDLYEKKLIVFGKNDNKIFDFLKKKLSSIKISSPEAENLNVLKPESKNESFFTNVAESIINLLRKESPIQELYSQQELNDFVRNPANLAENKLKSISEGQAIF